MATQTLQNDHLTVGTDQLPDQHHGQGARAVDQNPTAGTSVSKNSAVNLVVSDGPNIPTVTVPSVTDEQLTHGDPAAHGGRT